MTINSYVEDALNYEAWKPYGYSMITRQFDCSSFVATCLDLAPFNTATMRSVLITLGFIEIVKENNVNNVFNYDCQKGDIFIWSWTNSLDSSQGANGHTGIFIDDNLNVAHFSYGYQGYHVDNYNTLLGYQAANPPKIESIFTLNNSSLINSTSSDLQSRIDKAIEILKGN